MPKVFDNRELALLAWAVALLVFVIVNKSLRSSMAAVVDALFEPQLLTTFILMAVYAGFLVWLLSLARIWTSAIIAETIFWFFGPAIVLYSQFDKASHDPHFFRRTAVATVKVTVVVEFVINLYPMPLILELLLVPVLAFIAGMLAVATRPEHRQLKGCLEFLFAAFGFVLVGYTVMQVLHAPKDFATLDNLRAFVAPILLSLAFLPFVYAVAVFALYDRLSRMLHWRPGGKDLPAYAKRRVFRAALFRLRTVRRFADDYSDKFMRASSRADIDRAIREIKGRRGVT
jgi:hypothetical protein